MTELVLVSSRAEAQVAVRTRASGERIVALEWAAEDELEQLGAPFTALHTWLDDASFREATAQAYEWATRWYAAPDVAAVLDANGVSLGRAVEYPIYYRLVTALRTAVSLGRLVDGERPVRVAYFAKSARSVPGLMVRDGDLFTEGAVLALAPALGLDLMERPAVGACAKGPRGMPRASSFVRRAASDAQALLRRLRPVASGAVCFLSVDGSVHPLYAPVVRALRQRGQAVMMLAASPGLRSSVGPRVIAVGDLVPAAQRAAHRARFTATWRSLRDTLEPRFTYRDLRVWPLLSAGFERLFVDVVPAAADVAEAVRRLHATAPVRTLVAVNEIAEYFRTALLTAETIGVPSMTILHGVPTRLHRFFIGNEPAIASRMAVWGEACRAVKIENGAHPDRIAVTGAPHLDGVVRAPRPRPHGAARSAAMRRFGLDPSRRLVVFAPDHLNMGKLTYDVTLTPADHTTMVTAVARAMAAIPNAQLLVKLKIEDPSGPRVRRLLARNGLADARVIHETSWPRLFAITDVLVMAHSTVGLEALLHDVPLVTVNFTGRPDRVDFAKSGVALGVYEPATLRDSLEAALFQPDVRARLCDATPAFLAAFAGRLDGRSAERVAALATSMAASGDRA